MGTAKSAPPRWRRLEPDQRREQIFEQAIRLFGERPYAEVSTTDIAAEAGVARALVNHYFGGKRDLYLAVVRHMVTVPPMESVTLPTGSLRERVAACVDWLLRAIGAHGKTWVAVVAAEGIGSDPEVERILHEADDAAADRVLQVVGLAAVGDQEHARAVVRAYGGLVKAAAREWLVRGALTRDQVHTLLTDALVRLVEHDLSGAA